MNSLVDNNTFNICLLITIIGEFLLPYVLKYFYKEYNSKTMVMSVLGCSKSPVKKIYNIWLIWLGVFLLLTSFLIFNKIRTISNIIAILTFISISFFSVGAGVLAGLFSVNDTKKDVSIASKIHGVGSALGFMTLLFFPLLQSIISIISNDIIQGTIYIISFVFAIVCFCFFIMGDKEKYKNTIFAYEGLWERLCLFFMYVPFLYNAINNLFFN